MARTKQIVRRNMDQIRLPVATFPAITLPKDLNLKHSEPRKSCRIQRRAKMKRKIHPIEKCSKKTRLPEFPRTRKFALTEKPEGTFKVGFYRKPVSLLCTLRPEPEISTSDLLGHFDKKKTFLFSSPICKLKLNRLQLTSEPELPNSKEKETSEQFSGTEVDEYFKALSVAIFHNAKERNVSIRLVEDKVEEDEESTDDKPFGDWTEFKHAQITVEFVIPKDLSGQFEGPCTFQVNIDRCELVLCACNHIRMCFIKELCPLSTFTKFIHPQSETVAVVQTIISVDLFREEIQTLHSDIEEIWIESQLQWGSKALKESQCFDFKLICKGRTFPCHRVFLESQSPAFKEILADGDLVCMEQKDGERWGTYEMEAMDPKSVEALLKFIYCGDLSSVKGDKEIILQLFQAANDFGIKSLENALTKLLDSQVLTFGPGIALKFFTFANQFPNKYEGLTQKALQVMKIMGNDLVDCEEYEKLTKKDPELAKKLVKELIAL